MRNWRPSPTRWRIASKAGSRCRKPQGRDFTDEQRQWLLAIKDHIAGSVSIDLGDLQYAPFAQRGGIGRANALFADGLAPLLEELNLALAG